MEEVLIFATTLGAIIAALVQLVKKTVNVPNNLIPIIAFVIGLAVGAVAYPFTDLDLVHRLWSGGIAGLAATGLYEAVIAKRSGTSK
ncbi:holin [Terribacillus saccharophilus]|jgi:hypothetical protein|uniref:holin n=1 Tax=Terribacillus saccharophilus TaxID=361277 RepID=UPI000BA59B2C|nr:holin [Terribacillus saccharophilus]PAF19765.1 holin [Terribacillus saccharophilus]